MAVSGVAKVVLHTSACSTFNSSDWTLLGLRTGQLDWMRNHGRFFRSLAFGDEDFSEHSLDLVERLLIDEANVCAFLEFPELVGKLSAENAQVLKELRDVAARHPAWQGHSKGVGMFSRGVAATFDRADWLKLGTLANCRAEITGHGRLLRSLDFDDDDYLGHAIEMVAAILSRQDDNYKLFGHFPDFLTWMQEHYPAAATRLFPPTSPGTTPQPVRPATSSLSASSQNSIGRPLPNIPQPAVALKPFVPVLPAASGPPTVPTTLDTIQALLREIELIPAGNDHATDYHQKVERLLSIMFEGDLSDPKVEDKLHEGRKRVDITYTNRSTTGFFHWFVSHYNAHIPAPNVFVECKNYGEDPGNPAVDQLSGRFSMNRGRLGLLVCRTFGSKDPERLIQRCRDTLADSRGLILPLEDSDLGELVRLAASEGREQAVFQVLKGRLDRIVK